MTRGASRGGFDLSLRFFLPLVILVLQIGVVCADEEKLFAYKARQIYPASAPVVENGLLVVRGKKVEAVLQGFEKPPDGAELVDLGAAVIVPGFVNPLTAMSEKTYMGYRAPSIPSLPAGSPGDSRNVVALASVKAEEMVYRRLGRSGYTALAWVPATSGFIAGQASVLRPSVGGEKLAKELSLRDSAYLFVSFEMGNRWRIAVEKAFKKAAAAIVKEREEKEKKDEKKTKERGSEGREPEKKEQDKEESGFDDPVTPDGDGEKKDPVSTKKPKPSKPEKDSPTPLIDAFRGETTMFIRVRSPAAVDHLLRVVDGLPVMPRFVLVTPPQPAETVEKISGRKDLIRGVVVEPRMGTFWQTSVLVHSARLFSERGLEVAMVPLSDTLDGHLRMPFLLAEMLKGGMFLREVLAGVTTVPASFLGLEGKVGRLAEGAFASFAVYHGDPFGGNARLAKVFVEGVEVFVDDVETLEVSGEAVK